MHKISFLLVISISSISINSHASTNIEDSWWIKWSDIKKQGLISENQTCDTLSSKASLTQEQKSLIKKKCTDIIFYDSFNNEEGNGYAPLMDNARFIHYGLNYGSLLKWDVLDAPVRLYKYKNGHASTSDTSDDEGFVLGLRGLTYGSSAKIETKGALKLEPGAYNITYKLKPTSLHGLQKYTGVVTTIQGNGVFIKDKSYARSTYNCNDWMTVKKNFTVKKKSNVYISMEDMFNGTDVYGSMIDDIILIKTNDDGPTGALSE